MAIMYISIKKPDGFVFPLVFLDRCFVDAVLCSFDFLPTHDVICLIPMQDGYTHLLHAMDNISPPEDLNVLQSCQ